MTTELQKRCDSGVEISEDLYVSSLLDICDFLRVELIERLTEEGRFFGTAKDYMVTLASIFNGSVNKDVTDEDIEVFGKVLFLLKPVLTKEFKRLTRRSLSAGDSIIIIAKKIISTCLNTCPDHPMRREMVSIEEILEKFYGNMKNRKKSDPMFFLSGLLQELIRTGSIGKYEASELTLRTDEELRERRLDSPIEPGERLSHESGLIQEISWND